MESHDYARDYVIETCSEVDVDISEVSRKDGDELLIDLVRSRPYMYDKHERDYRDTQKKENAWREIASVMESSPSECQSRFLRLRQRFSKERQIRDNETRSGAGKSKRPAWILFDSMQFLNRHVLQRRSFTNVAGKSSSTVQLLKPEQSSGSCSAQESLNENEEVDEGSAGNIAPEVHYASSDATELQSPRSCSGGYQRKMKRAKVDPVQVAFQQMNSTLDTMASRFCSTEAKPSEDHDPDVIIGKLVTAELKKATGTRKEKMKKEFMGILYGTRE